jgi:hypothetical protein
LYVRFKSICHTAGNVIIVRPNYVITNGAASQNAAWQCLCSQVLPIFGNVSILKIRMIDVC